MPLQLVHEVGDVGRLQLGHDLADADEALVEPQPDPLEQVLGCAHDASLRLARHPLLPSPADSPRAAAAKRGSERRPSSLRDAGEERVVLVARAHRARDPVDRVVRHALHRVEGREPERDVGVGGRHLAHAVGHEGARLLVLPAGGEAPPEQRQDAVEVRVLAEHVLDEGLRVVHHAAVEEGHGEERLEQRVLGLGGAALVDLRDRLLEPALVRVDPCLVDGHEHEVLRVHLEEPIVEGERAVVQAVEPVHHRRHEQHRRVVGHLAQQLLDAGVGLVLVAVVEVDVDHLQPRVDDRRVDGEGVLERALGEHVVLGAAPALRVEHVAAAERRVGAREVGVLADRLVEEPHRLVEVGLLVGAQDVAEEGVAGPEVELVRLRARRERPLDLLLLLGGQPQLQPGEEPLGDLVLHVEQVPRGDVDLVGPQQVAARGRRRAARRRACARACG